MASIPAIAKGKALGLALKNVFGVEPNYTYLSDRVVVYYDDTQVVPVRSKINEMTTKEKSKKSDVEFQYFPLIAPVLIKKIAPLIVGSLITGYIIGKL